MELFANESSYRLELVRDGSARKRLMKSPGVLLALLSLSCLLATPAWATTTVLLNANFNDKPLNVQIGTGGPSVGEPIEVHPALVARVQATPLPTRSLHLRTANTDHRYLRFEFLGGAEIKRDEVRIAFTLRAPAVRTLLSFEIREQGSDIDKFGGLNFTASGAINSIDETGTVTNIRSFLANEAMDIEYIYHLNAGTYDLRINNLLLLDNRLHGVVDPLEGIGRIVFGTNGTQDWVIDEIAVTHTTPNTLLLDANFNDKPLDAQIGTGGPTLGEPVAISAGLNAIVRAAPLGSRSLYLSQPGSGVERSATFALLDGDEVKRGQLRVAFTVRTPPVADIFSVRVRQVNSVILRFGGVDFTASGRMQTFDNFSTPATIGFYEPNQTLRFDLVYQVVAKTYDLYIDGRRVFAGRAYNGSASADVGISALNFELDANTTQEWVVDDLHIKRNTALLDADFNDQVLNQQIGMGGAAAGQPFQAGDGTIVEVRNGLFPTPALTLEAVPSEISASASFGLINNQAIRNGELRISVRVLPPSVFHQLAIAIQGAGGLFGFLNFDTNGNIFTFDDAGDEFVATYMPGVEKRLEFRYHLDAGTYDIYVDRLPTVVNRAWGSTVGAGIKEITVSSLFQPRQWVLDDLYVYQPNDVLFKHGFE